MTDSRYRTGGENRPPTAVESGVEGIVTDAAELIAKQTGADWCLVLVGQTGKTMLTGSSWTQPTNRRDMRAAAEYLREVASKLDDLAGRPRE